MVSKLIQFRLSGEELEALEAQVKEGDSINLVAQRILIEALGVDRGVDKVSTPDWNEQIESMLEDKFSSFTGNVNDLLSRLQERLQRVESRLEGMSVADKIPEATTLTVDSVDKTVDGSGEVASTAVDTVYGVDKPVDESDEVAATAVDTVDLVVDKEGDRSLSQVELAKRLKVHPATLSKNRSKANFVEWSRGKDPEKLAWEYQPSSEQYIPLSTSVDLTVDKDHLAGWKARVDAVVGVL